MAERTHTGDHGDDVPRFREIVRSFDDLVMDGAGVDGLVRAAAILAGVTAGATVRGRTVRRGADGTLMEAVMPASAPVKREGDGWRVWLEGLDNESVAEAVVERLAFSVTVLGKNRSSENPLEIALDPDRNTDERATALARLRIGADSRIRMIATAVEDSVISGPSVVIATKYGPMRAAVDRVGEPLDAGHEHWAGLGSTVTALQAPESWEAAMIGLRLTSAEYPVVDGSELGAMVILASQADPELPHPDVVALADLDPHTYEILLALVETDSIRAAAARLAMHHSTVQARHKALVETLGYDARTPLGRMRFIAANLLFRLTHP